MSETGSRKYLDIRLTLILFSCFRVLVSAIKLNIITVYTGQNPMYGYIATGPAYIAALEKAKTMYPEVYLNSSLYTVYYPGGLIICADGAVQMTFMAGNIDITDILERLSGFTVIYTAGCSLETMALGDFAREWNTPLFSNTAGDSRINNKLRFPTVVTGAGPDHTSMPTALLDLLDLLNWHTVTLICDAMSQYPGLNAFFTLSCANLRIRQSLRRVKFNFYNSDFDSKFEKNYVPYLMRAKSQSRIIVLVTHPKIMREIMLTAYQLGMTNGDYIFLASMSTTVTTRGPVTWNFNDGRDEMAFEAFKHLIIYNNVDPDWNNITNWVAKIASTAETHFSTTLTEDEKYNEFAISAYEVMLASAQVLRESFNDTTLDGRSYARRFWNRTFQFPSRKFTIGPYGMRVVDVLFSRLNISSGLMEEAWHYDAVTRVLRTSSQMAMLWPYSGGSPPPNRPACGYHDELCDKISYTFPKEAIVAVVVLLSLIVCACVRYYVRNRKHHHQGRYPLWWFISTGEDELKMRMKDEEKLGYAESAYACASWKKDLIVVS